jgi:hypothetical protein
MIKVISKPIAAQLKDPISDIQIKKSFFLPLIDSGKVELDLILIWESLAILSNYVELNEEKLKKRKNSVKNKSPN